jgi:uncharacterized protein (TIGR02466 family)
MKNKRKNLSQNGYDQDGAELHKLFTTIIYETMLELDTESIANHCLKIKKSTKSVYKTNVGGWQSHAFVHSINHSSSKTGDCPALDEMFASIVKHANIFKDTFLFKHPLALNNAWVSINSHRDYNVEHSHPHSFISGVYYVRVPVKSGAIRFFNPVSEIMQRDWDAVERHKYNPYNCEHWTLIPENNKLFLFPSWLKHSVLPNFNKRERISISFNLR